MFLLGSWWVQIGSGWFIFIIYGSIRFFLLKILPILPTELAEHPGQITDKQHGRTNYWSSGVTEEPYFRDAIHRRQETIGLLFRQLVLIQHAKFKNAKFN